MSQTLIGDELIRADGVTFREGGRLILQDVSLSLSKGQIVSIVGPNGAGKTTLLKILLGLIKPSAGKVSTPANLCIGYMPQRLEVDPLFPLSVRRFLELGQAASSSLESTLKEVGIGQVILNNPLYTLSGGELQRVLLARALLRNPALLVLDEPAQGVDLLGQGEFYDLIARIREKQGCAILLVSHDLNVVMAQTDIVVCLNQHVCCQGHPDKVSKDPAFTALFGHVAQNLAFYTHRHDHQHDVHGGVVCQDHKHD
ncbi:MAG: ATP-binding cassette domain-containing protein [Candidatus Berkiella sp.]